METLQQNQMYLGHRVGIGVFDGIGFGDCVGVFFGINVGVSFGIGVTYLGVKK